MKGRDKGTMRWGRERGWVEREREDGVWDCRLRDRQGITRNGVRENERKRKEHTGERDGERE